MSAEFDRHAAVYDGGLDNPIKRLMGNSADQFVAVKGRWLLRKEPDLKTGRLKLLDYGCGVGDLMRNLGLLGARADFTGSDVSAGMLAEVEKRWPAGIGNVPRLVRQDGVCTLLPDRQFDIVVVSAVLHHVPPGDRPAVYAEVGRLLKPGGRLYVFEHNPRNPLVRYVVARTPIDANAVLLDSREVCADLREIGRFDLDVTYLMFMPPRIGFLRGIDRALARLPLGAQYAVRARKAA